MTAVRIQGLVKEFGGSTAVKGIDLSIKHGEFITLLGPSGCGKTTTLRCLAGLEVPTEGEITFGSQTMSSSERNEYVPPESRGLGMVFQSYALWPHMTVNSTVGYPLKMTKTPREKSRRTIADILERVHLADRGDDYAVSLSGGQQQRVALARAMVNNPSVILFDEPLSNLDVKLRNSMRSQIRNLHDEMGTTSIYVTHDQEEAIALADRVVVMNAGRIEQVASPMETYTRPRNAFVADFMGFQNILPAHAVGSADQTTTIELDETGTRLLVSSEIRIEQSTELLVAFRASHVHLDIDSGDERDRDAIRGTIRNVTYLGNSIRVLVDAKETMVRAQVDEREFSQFGPDDLVPGRMVALRISPQNIVPLPAPGHDEHAEPDAVSLSNSILA